MLSLEQMRHLSIVLYAVFLFSCAPAVKGRFVMEAISVERKGASFQLKLEYPVIAGAPAALNKHLADAALIHLEQVENDPVPIDEYAKNLAAESAGQQWVIESVTTVAHQSANILTTLCKTYTNTGGAHPNVFHYYEVYDLKTGRLLDLSDLLEGGKLNELRAIAIVSADYPNEPKIGLLKDKAIYRADPDARMVAEVEIPTRS
jgi:hypothetical protein